ncbi:MAG: DUF1080 domain-containing protein [bacterium]
MKRLLGVLLAVPFVAMAVHGAEEAAVPPISSLFNGKDLSGWKSIGGGKWYVADECIVGETGDGRYGWLVTEKEYSDFILDLQFKPEAAGNAGIQFRSHVIDGEMYGYQAECDPTPGMHTGGVYEEKGRGWLAQPTPEGEKALKPNDWNTYRVQMIGDHIQTFLNGQKIADFHDGRTIRGIIALQVHSGQTPPVKMRWKDIAIQDLGYGPGWQPLFNGQNLDGWVEHGKEKWYVEDGMIVGKAVTNEYGYLSTQKAYKNFVLRLKFNAEGAGNSGLFYHSRLEDVKIYGVQAEIDPTPGKHTGGLYESYGRNWLILPNAEAEKLMRPIGQWNEMQIWVKDNHVITHLNGFLAVDYVDENPRDTDGVIALQLHSGGQAAIRFEDIYIKEIQ